MTGAAEKELASAFKTEARVCAGHDDGFAREVDGWIGVNSGLDKTHYVK